MKQFKLLSIALLVLGAQNAMAQTPDSNDTNTDTHLLNITVAEAAILDVYNSATTEEANQAPIVFDTGAGATQGADEAGLYNFSDIPVNNDLYLNYTSVVNASGTDTSRSINVDFQGGTFPGGLKLRITPEAPAIEDPNAGTVGAGGSAGDSVTAGITLNDESIANATGVDIVTGVKSVYTGDGEYGVRLTYSLEQDGNFADYLASTYSTTVLYTLTDN